MIGWGLGAAAIVALTGCPFDAPTPPPAPQPPNGELGRALFVSGTLAAQAGATVSTVTCVPVASASVTSGASVVSATAVSGNVTTTTGCGLTTNIALQTGAPGPVTLTLRDASGGELDRFTLQVSAVQSIRFTPATARVFASSDVSGSYVLLDAMGATLAGCPSVTPGSTGSVSAPVVGGACGDCSTICFHADSAGAGTMTMTLGAVGAMLPVDVIAPSAVTAITLDAASGSVPSGFRGLATMYRFVVPGGPVHGMACTWVSSNPAIADYLVDSYGARLLGSEAAANLGVRTFASGTVTFHCVIPFGASASYRLTVR